MPAAYEYEAAGEGTCRREGRIAAEVAPSGCDRVHAGGMSRNAERMLKARLILAEKMRQYPEGRRLYRRARAAIELSRAESSAPLPAAWACVKAIGWSPADVRAWKGLARWPLSVFRGRTTARH